MLKVQEAALPTQNSVPEKQSKPGFELKCEDFLAVDEEDIRYSNAERDKSVFKSYGTVMPASSKEATSSSHSKWIRVDG